MMRRIGCLLQLVVFMLLVGMWVAPSVYLDTRGIVGPGTVVEKHEDIDRYRRSLSWGRRLNILVEYQPPEQDAPSRAAISVDEATYDRLQIGDTVRVRYQPTQWLRDFLLLNLQARLEHQSTLTTVLLFVDSTLLLAIFGLLLLFLIGAAIKARSPSMRVAVITVAVLDLGAVALLAMWPTIRSDQGGERSTAMATVRNVERFTKRPASPGRRRGARLSASRELWGPFDRVQLEVESGGRTVVAVDDIDADSVPGLAVGAQVAVAYPQQNPREARIVDATRRHVLLNLLGFIVVPTLYIGVLLAIALLLLVARRAWRRRQAAVSAYGRAP